MKFTEEKIGILRERIKNDSSISEKRRVHILAVESMAVRLARLYAPDKKDVLAVAALLHDITKEYSTDMQIDICKKNGHEPDAVELNAPKTFHQRTAAYLIPLLYPEYADIEVIDAVRWHTTGHSGMTLTEKLVYLADYIDDSRKFEDCVLLRKAFFDAQPEKMTADERIAHLNDVLILSFDMTVRGLLEQKLPISRDTVDAMNELIIQAKEQRSKKQP